MAKDATKKRVGPLEFARQVRAELAKVTWPSRRETIITTVMVFIMVFLASVFFFVADQIFSWGIQMLLSLSL